MRKWMKKTAVICAALLFVTGCSGKTTNSGTDSENTLNGTETAVNEGNTGNTENGESIGKLTLSAGYLSLKTGETSQITVSDAENVTFTSSNPKVAKVDKNGVVTAVKKGNALIVAEADGKRGTCGVMIDLVDESIDIAGKTMTPFVTDLKIAKSNVMQGFTIKPDGTLYIIQQFNGTPADCVMTKVKTDGTQEYMRLVEFGHGNTIAVDWDEEGNDYLWVPSVGNVEGTSNGMSRIKWEAGAFYQEQAGDTWTEGVFYNNPNCAVDMNSRRMLVLDGDSGMKCYIYDLDGFISGELTEPLCSVELPKSTMLGEPGSSYFQGIALDGEYIYTYEGKPGELIFISTFDLDGNWLYSRNVEGYADLEYREAEGIAISNGKIYIGIASGLSNLRRANVFSFE